MDTLPPLDTLPSGASTGAFRKVPKDQLDAGKYYFYSVDNEMRFIYRIDAIRNQGGDDREAILTSVARWDYSNSKWMPIAVKPNRYKGYSSQALDSLWVPTTLENTTENKAKVQAVKDVLANQGLPDTQDTGPLGNILGMAGIKAPPKRTGLGRSRKVRGKARRKTRRARK